MAEARSMSSQGRTNTARLETILQARTATSLTLMKADSSSEKKAEACAHTRGRKTKMQAEDVDMPKAAASARLSRKTDGVVVVASKKKK
jgi:hypothetical protein